MKTPDDLFLLIKSLSKQEKRYFKLFISKFRQKNNCILLFDILNEQNEYDEEEIRKIFNNEAFIKELHVTKNYLYSAILRSLNSYHSNLTSNFKIKNLLNYAEILFHKGLYKQSKKILKKAKIIAYQYENHLALIEIIFWQSRISHNETKPSELKKYILEDSIEESNLIEQLRNKFQYRRSFFEIIYLNNTGTPARDHSTLLKYNNIINNDFLKDEQNATNFYSKLLYYTTLAYYYFNTNDIPSSNIYCKKGIELMEANPIQIRENYTLYVAILNNLAYSGSQLKEKNESFEAIKKMRNIPTKYFINKDLTNDIINKIFIRSNFLELNIYIESGEFQQAHKLTNQIIQKLTDIEDKLDFTYRYKLFLYFNISYTFFGVEDYKNALFWLNKILNTKDTKEPTDLFCFGRILNYIIHFETGNVSFIDNINCSNIRFFKKNNKLYEFETIVFDFFNKELNNPNHIQKNKNFIKIRNQLNDLIITLNDNKGIQYFDLLTWLDSKIEKKKFSEIKKRKVII
jgi:hypothetical protein